MHIYIATVEFLRIHGKYIEEANKVPKARNEYARSLGAYKAAGNETGITGFYFKHQPDTEVWKQKRDQSWIYKKRDKATQALREKLKEPQFRKADIIGIKAKHFCLERINAQFFIFELHQVGKQVYVRFFTNIFTSLDDFKHVAAMTNSVKLSEYCAACEKHGVNYNLIK